MSRYFLAIVPPEPICNGLTAWQPLAGKGIKPVRPEQLHLTLHFLGELTDEDRDSVKSMVETTRFSSFSLTLRGLGTFPAGITPRVLWAGIDESRELARLHSDLAQRLTDTIGFQSELRRFHAHITLARMKPTANRELIESHLQAHASISLPSFEVDHICLFQSRLTESGARYEIVATSK